MESGPLVCLQRFGIRTLVVAIIATFSFPLVGEARGKRGAMRAAAEAREERLLQDPAAALRAARDAWDAQKTQRAQEILLEVVERHPIVASHANWMLAEIVLAQGRPEDAERFAATALAEGGLDPLMISRFHDLMGKAQEAQGDHAAARAAWEKALGAPHSSDDVPRLLLSLGRSWEADGNIDRAAAEYVALWTRRPLSAEAEVASARLDVLSETLESDPRTPRVQYRRAESLLRSNRNELALAAYNEILAGDGSSKGFRNSVRRKRANVLFRMRLYDEAIVAYSELPGTLKNKILIARSQARAGDVPSAVTSLKQLAESVGANRPQRELYLAALLLDDEEGRKGEARALFEKLATPVNAGEIRNEAVWRLGWGSYQAGEYEQAIARFDELYGYQEASIDGLRPRYWRARALEKQGDPKAKREFFSLASEYPLTYYGWRASLREQEEGPPPSRPKPIVEEDRLAPADLERARILARAGFGTEAGGEILQVSERAGGYEDRLAIAELLRDAGFYHQAQGWVMKAYLRELARGPQPARAALWSHAWPRAYEREVNRASSRFDGVDPELVFAVMREESGYRPKVVSVSGARGLLQIMPETGSRLAGKDDPSLFDAETLFEPQTNVMLGTLYLSQLREQFDGRIAPAVASYNAGPTAVSEWVASAPPEQEEDEWVETIPYTQTRNYVKRVLRSVHAYRVID